MANKLRILAQSFRPAASRARFALSAGQWLAMALLFGSGVASFGLVPGEPQDAVPTQIILRELPNPVALIPNASDDAAAAGAHY